MTNKTIFSDKQTNLNDKQRSALVNAQLETCSAERKTNPCDLWDFADFVSTNPNIILVSSLQSKSIEFSIFPCHLHWHALLSIINTRTSQMWRFSTSRMAPSKIKIIYHIKSYRTWSDSQLLFHIFFLECFLYNLIKRVINTN